MHIARENDKIVEEEDVTLRRQSKYNEKKSSVGTEENGTIEWGEGILWRIWWKKKTEMWNEK